jgi:hypothetical protein
MIHASGPLTQLIPIQKPMMPTSIHVLASLSSLAMRGSTPGRP